MRVRLACPILILVIEMSVRWDILGEAHHLFIYIYIFNIILSLLVVGRSSQAFCYILDVKMFMIFSICYMVMSTYVFKDISDVIASLADKSTF